MTETLSIQEVFAMVAQHEISASEAFQLVKDLRQTGQGAKSKSNPEPGLDGLLPRIEHDLAQIAANILNISQHHLDKDGDLKDYGFGSITLTRFTEEINEKYTLEILPTVFFELGRSTLGSLANYLYEKYPAEFTRYYFHQTPVMKTNRVKTTPLPASGTLAQAGTRQSEHEPIAIIGMSGVLPQSENLDIFWQHLEAGDDLISEIPRERWNWQTLPNYPESCRWGGFIKEVDKFDADFFGISPREARMMDPQQRIFLEILWKTIEDAGYNAADLAGTKTGLFVGVSSLDYHELLLSGNVDFDAHVMNGLAHSMLTNRISYLLDLHGPSQPVNTACSSSLIALHRAVETLRSGVCEMAIAGGINLILAPTCYKALHSAGVLSGNGRCKTFDLEADGFVRAEGGGAILLKPLSRARTDNDHIYALIKGSAENHGGRAHSLTAPNANAQADLLTTAFADARVEPWTIGYIETHGTGTILGDPVEINGLKKAFAELFKKGNRVYNGKPYCGLGSVKTNIGHLEAAAGIASVLKVLLAFQHKKLPANVNFKTQNPYLELDNTPFYIVARTQPWECIRDDRGRPLPRRAGVSSFGFGGANAHIVLEEYPEAQSPLITTSLDPQVIVLSARDDERLKAYARQMMEYLDRQVPSEAPPLNQGEAVVENFRKELVKTLARILHVDEGQIHPEENLAEYGLDPVDFTRTAETLKEKFQIDIQAVTFSKFPTIHALEQHFFPERPDPAPTASQSVPPAQISLEDMAYTLQVGRQALEKRLALVAHDFKELRRQLQQFIQGEIHLRPVTPNASQDLYRLADRFMAGKEVQWQQIHRGKKPRRVSLPTYPFEKNRYWFDTGQVPMKNSYYTPNQELTPKIKIKRKDAEETRGTADYYQSSQAGTGKVVLRPVLSPREAVPSLKSEPAPAREAAHSPSPGVTTARVKEILAGILFMAPGKIDENKAFMEMGLDSILAVEFVKRLQEAFNVGIKATQLYDYSTVTRLTRFVLTLSPAIRVNQGERDKTGENGSLLTQVRDLLAGVLFMDPKRIDPGKPFKELGLDSILTVEFAKHINEEFQTDIKTTKLYDYSTLNALAAYLSSLGVTGSKMLPTKAPQLSTPPGLTVPDPGPVPPVSAESLASSVLTSSLASLASPLSSAGRESRDVAIIGISAKFPGANSAAQFWQNLEMGVDSVSEVPPERWEVHKYYDPDPQAVGKTTCKWGGFLQDIDQFDTRFFSISPAEAELMDPQQRLFLQEAWKALEDAGYSARDLDNLKCGVYVGVMSGIEYASHSMFNAHSILAARISYFLNLKGPALSIDTACSSSLVALHLACQSLVRGETEMMLVGGVTLYLTEKPYIGMSRMGDILSRDGKCKAFDNSADGFVPGEGVGVAVLKLLDKANADGDHIYGVIKGTGINQDGKTNGITAPSVQSQRDLEVEVYRNFNIDPGTISYVEAHGTGTKLGDPIEIDALTEAFRCYTGKRQFCPIGSVKTNLGHTSAAAGMAGLIKVLLSMKHKKIPPSLHFHQENEHINFKETPFYVNTRLIDWKSPGTFPRRAALSSFGYSGTNAHIIIEEPPKPGYPASTVKAASPFYFMPLSARNEEALKNRVSDLIQWLQQEETHQKYSPGDIAYTLGPGRSHFDLRAVLVVRDTEDFRHTLEKILKGENPGNYFMDKIKKTGSPGESTLQNLSSSLLKELTASRQWSASDYKNKLTALANFYIGGGDLDWKLFYQKEGYKRISLPGYPFAGERYWIPIEKTPRQFLTSESLPRKIKRSPARVRTNVTIDETYIKDQIQKHLAKLIQDILKVKEKDIDPEGNLLEYGFDSISFTGYIKEINQAYNIELAIESVFDLGNPTIRSLSQWLYEQYRDRFMQYFRELSTGLEEMEEVEEVETVEEAAREENEPIAIIGISAVMPQSENLALFWKNLEEEKTLVTEIPGKNPVTEIPGRGMGIEDSKGEKGGFLNLVEAFDPAFFGISPGEAKHMDPPQRIFLEIAWKLIEDAGYKASGLAGTLTGVFVGSSGTGYMIANRVSNFFDFHGPSEAIDTGGSSSLAAIHRAVEALRWGTCHLAVAGCVHVIHQSAAGSDIQEGGYIPGEGAAAVLLKPLSRALADRDHIYAVIKETAENHAGRPGTIAAPDGSTLAKLLNDSYERAGIDPETLTYYEAHGTGAAPGDAEEIAALKSAFEQLYKRQGKSFPQEPRCGIGSVKANIGDLGPASGIAGVIKVLLAMKYKKLPGLPVPYVPRDPRDETNLPMLNLEGTPFYMVKETRPWESLPGNGKPAIPRRAGVSSCGTGGTNVHVVLEEYPDSHSSTVPDPKQEEEKREYLIPLSARNKERLNLYARDMLNFLEKGSSLESGTREDPSPDILRIKLEEDVLALASGLLVMKKSGYDQDSVAAFLQRLNNTFKLEITPEVFISQPSLGTFIKYLRKNYKKEFKRYYHSTPVTGLNLTDMAYTLQLGREAMPERLTIVVSSLEELKDKLNAYCQGRSDIANLSRGNSRETRGQDTLLLLEGEEKEEFVKTIIKNRKFSKLGYCWVIGVDIDWKLLYTDQTPKRISLPTYPLFHSQLRINN